MPLMREKLELMGGGGHGWGTRPTLGRPWTGARCTPEDPMESLADRAALGASIWGKASSTHNEGCWRVGQKVTQAQWRDMALSCSVSNIGRRVQESPPKKRRLARLCTTTEAAEQRHPTTRRKDMCAHTRCSTSAAPEHEHAPGTDLTQTSKCWQQPSPNEERPPAHNFWKTQPILAG